MFPQREEDAYITEEDIGYQPIDFDNLPGKSRGSRQSSAKSRSSHHSANSKRSSKSTSKLLNRLIYHLLKYHGCLLFAQTVFTCK